MYTISHLGEGVMESWAHNPWVELLVAPLFSGLLTSRIFLLLVSRFKPSLKISAKIARMPARNSGGGGSCGGYAIKVVNSSKRSALELARGCRLAQRSKWWGALSARPMILLSQSMSYLNCQA